MEPKSTIIIIEDEKNICSFIETILEAHGYVTSTATNGNDGIALIASTKPSVVLLDLSLPDIDGLEVIRRVRLWSTVPIIVISARTLERSKVAALDLGADDYLTKPFAIQELVARAGVQIRRFAQTAGAPPAALHYKDLTLTPETFSVTCQGQPVELTRQEFRILELLLSHPGRVFSKQAIYDYAWEEMYLGEDKTINVHISNIRKKLRGVSDREYIETVWGIGFRLAP